MRLTFIRKPEPGDCLVSVPKSETHKPLDVDLLECVSEHQLTQSHPYASSAIRHRCIDFEVILSNKRRQTEPKDSLI